MGEAPGWPDLIMNLLLPCLSDDRALCLPIAERLGIPLEKVFANKMMWQMSDETGMPDKVRRCYSSLFLIFTTLIVHTPHLQLVGFDQNVPTAKNMGKAEAIAVIRQNNPYGIVAMVGDGITDLEAVQVSGGADLFIG